MPTYTKNAAYNQGKIDAKAGRPKDPSRHVEKSKYNDGYNKQRRRMEKAQAERDAIKKPVVRDTRAYDYANDEYFPSNAAMDRAHGIKEIL